MQTCPVRTVKVEPNGHSVELGNATPEQQQRLGDAFLAVADDSAG
ncbi:hypothetical protein ACFV7R_23270 [Streptomyces sp. NPDC059866]